MVEICYFFSGHVKMLFYMRSLVFLFENALMFDGRFSSVRQRSCKPILCT